MSLYRLAADAVALAHASYVAFVVFGLVAIVTGLAMGKPWARNFWFRIVHLAMIGIVVLQAWLGIVCPLTTLEKTLRRLAGEEDIYGTDFIEHWVHRVIFFDLPPWAFITAYTLFGLVVLATFVFYPPRWNATGKK
ncbi:DUF2784 domain-containing protein [Tautonia plasticadhaerens]|uniref:DUF2784 domain-containing protein n=1 Tax=Tautonia plasticadhaerens TaxID=2527974 RepID=A0A518HEN2_9BACT|nr:DUF2784 domain-containing protein [Tautonia plasticadhaerens]QDV39303.1 hypothetical protein ElP_72670 [Tautonia plasticadhaerens]